MKFSIQQLKNLIKESMDEMSSNSNVGKNLLAELNAQAEAFDHPQFNEAYQALVEENEDRLPFREKDVSEETLLAYMLTNVTSLFVEGGKLYAGSRDVATEPYCWNGSKWVCDDDGEDEEESPLFNHDDEDEDSDF